MRFLCPFASRAARLPEGDCHLGHLGHLGPLGAAWVFICSAAGTGAMARAFEWSSHRAVARATSSGSRQVRSRAGIFLDAFHAFVVFFFSPCHILLFAFAGLLLFLLFLLFLLLFLSIRLVLLLLCFLSFLCLFSFCSGPGGGGGPHGAAGRRPGPDHLGPGHVPAVASSGTRDPGNSGERLRTQKERERERKTRRERIRKKRKRELNENTLKNAEDSEDSCNTCQVQSFQHAS